MTVRGLSSGALQVDKRLEEALRHTVKRSLQELSRVLNGDKKTEVVPVFNVMLVLEKTNRVELKPTVQVSALLMLAFLSAIHNRKSECMLALQLMIALLASARMIPVRQTR